MGIRFNTAVRSCLLSACLAWSPTAARAEWQATEKIASYAIAGKSGAELYASIGERGPKAGSGRAIAHTNFKLTWTRKYEQRNGACVIASALPKLIITYTLPEPSQQLSPAMRRNWDVFIAGVRSHEKVHGEDIKDMVRQIEAASLGLSVADDAGCRKFRIELAKRLNEISLAQRQRSRDFDRTELGEGGNIQRLILKLVNGK